MKPKKNEKVEEQKPVVSETEQPVDETVTEETTEEMVEEPKDNTQAEEVTETTEQENTEEEIIETPEQDPTLSTDQVANRLVAILKRFYPEAKTDTAEDIMAALVPLLEGVIALNDDLTEVGQEFPEFLDMILGLRKGMTPGEAIATFFNPEDLMPPEGAPDYEKTSMAKESRRKKIQEREETIARVKGNHDVTAKNLLQAQEQLGLDDETTSNIAKLAGAIIMDATQDGIISLDNWIKLANGLRHENIIAEKDNEIAKSFEDGQVAGRNAKIEKKRMGKETGDGVAKLSSSGVINDKKGGPKTALPIRKEFRV